MQSDWRLTNQMNYLYGVTLKKSDFKTAACGDHAHCEFCFDKFSNEEGSLKFGYCTLDSYHWVCNKCFRDFCEQFEWKVLGND